MRRCISSACAALLFAGCAGRASVVENFPAGAIDDAGRADAGESDPVDDVVDAGAGDAGAASDAGAGDPDAGPVDAGEVDAGPCVDGDWPLRNEGIVEPAGLDGCPSGMALVDDGSACMDRWEAFLVEGTGSFSPFENPEGHDVKAKSAPGAVPQAYISGVEAAAACANSG